MGPLISISVVSHLQEDLVANLLSDIEIYCSDCNIEVLLTLNLPEKLSFESSKFRFPIQLIHNESPLGFGANHNQALFSSKGSYFCVLNPDIQFRQNPFNGLIAVLEDSSIGVVAPKVLNSMGALEDSARRFPSPIEIAGKLFGRQTERYLMDDPLIYPEWVAGMFMLFRKDVFKNLKGFDEKYFLYYEDVDLCARLTIKNYRIAVCTIVSVIHNARRTSHKSFKYFKWHLTSMLKFFLSRNYWILLRKNWEWKRL